MLREDRIGETEDREIEKEGTKIISFMGERLENFNCCPERRKNNCCPQNNNE